MTLAMKNINGELLEPEDMPKAPRFTSSQRTESMSNNSPALKIDELESGTDDAPKINNSTQKESKESAREMRRKKLEALSASVKKTKRVLQPRSDNPVWRPLGWTGDMPSTLLDMTPKSKPRRERKVTEEQKLDPFSETDEEEQPSDDESDGMSDFIVDDDESLGEDDSNIEKIPPTLRSARRLFRGRRQVQEGKEESEDLEIKMERLDITVGDIMSNLEDSSHEVAISSEESDCEVSQPEKAYKESAKPTRGTKEAEKRASKAVSDTEEAFTKQS